MGPTGAFTLIVWLVLHGTPQTAMFETDDKLTCWNAELAVESIHDPALEVKKAVCVPAKEV